MSEPSKLTAWERWELASFDEVAPTTPAATPDPATVSTELPPDEVVTEPDIHLPTAEELEQIYQQARTEGLQKGQEEGLQAGYQEGQKKAQDEALRLAQACGKLEQALGELEVEVADELLALAVALAREVVRQEISARPEHLQGVVREALSQLPHQHAAIYLHPDDASLLRSYQGDQLSHAGHRIHEDFKLKRGDCVIESGGTQLDASVAMRWQRALDSLGIAAAWQEEPATEPAAAATTKAATPAPEPASEPAPDSQPTPTPDSDAD